MNIAIIIPCFNEEKEIRENCLKVQSYLNEHYFNSDYHFSLIVVNDGSSDKTEEVINGINGIIPLTYKTNKGKGYAITYGFKYCLENIDFDYAIFMDADLSTNLDAIKPCLESLSEGYDMVIGSRYDKGSKIVIKRPFIRAFVSKCSRLIIKVMYQLGYNDTQCGFKGLTKETCSVLVNKSKMERFSFDVEWLYILKLNKKRVKVIPVTWLDDRESTVDPLKSSIRFFKDLFKIKKNKKDYYI